MGGLTNLRWLRLTALKSSPVTAFGSEVLSVSGKHPEPLPYYRASREQVYLGSMVSGTLPVSLVIQQSENERSSPFSMLPHHLLQLKISKSPGRVYHYSKKLLTFASGRVQIKVGRAKYTNFLPLVGNAS